ncbi:hypothetical protein K458DRAFT_396176 [Lentithecium fluviatile CBS 122367]|uniref:Uncharacterized protein n=1 Tax=Lentithecium fluviatile CBS 122367 TaxID=1168545 RepID=A0A6G1IGE6_9PLEO|nr:hypothetical protein K458DRAFT_396176 [Lentithecium fluviatile CBS 122367]
MSSVRRHDNAATQLDSLGSRLRQGQTPVSGDEASANFSSWSDCPLCVGTRRRQIRDRQSHIVEDPPGQHPAQDRTPGARALQQHGTLPYRLPRVVRSTSGTGSGQSMLHLLAADQRPLQFDSTRSCSSEWHGSRGDPCGAMLCAILHQAPSTMLDLAMSLARESGPLQGAMGSWPFPRTTKRAETNCHGRATGDPRTDASKQEAKTRHPAPTKASCGTCVHTAIVATACYGANRYWRTAASTMASYLHTVALVEDIVPARPALCSGGYFANPSLRGAGLLGLRPRNHTTFVLCNSDPLDHRFKNLVPCLSGTVPVRRAQKPAPALTWRDLSKSCATAVSLRDAPARMNSESDPLIADSRCSIHFDATTVRAKKDRTGRTGSPAGSGLIETSSNVRCWHHTLKSPHFPLPDGATSTSIGIERQRLSAKG